MKGNRFLAYLLIIGMVFSCSIGCQPEKPQVELNRVFKNIIVVIGDGMGENHILNAIDYFGLQTPAFLSDQKGPLLFLYDATPQSAGNSSSSRVGQGYIYRLSGATTLWCHQTAPASPC